ncbi:hypothetical protein ACIPL1_18720 [Pseudomonas sp. NPDC090202]|uniref:hypothetical protein n=1 Tax=unclassified Pseudomonas TaxID=196821 RepID=UPI0037F2172D
MAAPQSESENAANSTVPGIFAFADALALAQASLSGDNAGILPDMSQFTPRSIGAFGIVWKSPLWFFAERDLAEGERITVVAVSRENGSLLAHRDFSASKDNRSRAGWPAALADAVNVSGPDAWVKLGMIDEQGDFHGAPADGIVRLWGWSEEARVFCNAPFTGSMAMALVLPSLADAGVATLIIEVRDRLSQTLYERHLVHPADSDWQQQLNKNSRLVRAGTLQPSALSVVPTETGAALWVPQLSNMDVTLTPAGFDEKAAYSIFDNVENVPGPRREDGAPAVTFTEGSALFLPYREQFGSDLSRMNPLKVYSALERNAYFICRDNNIYLLSNENPVSTRSVVDYFNNFERHFIDETYELKVVCFSMAGRLPESELFLAGLGDKQDGGVVRRLRTTQIDFAHLLMEVDFDRFRWMTTCLPDPDGSNGVQNARDTRGEYYSRPHTNFTAEEVEKIKRTRSYAGEDMPQLPSEMLREDFDYYIEHDDIPIYQYYPIVAFPSSGRQLKPDDAFNMVIAEVSRSLISKRLDQFKVAYPYRFAEASNAKPSDTLCQDSAFTAGSEVFDTSGEAQSGVSPLTGLYHCHYPLAGLQSLYDPRVRLDLTLHYAATRANEAALGDGWALRMASFDNRLRRFTLHTGRAFTLTEKDIETLALGELVRDDLTLKGLLRKGGSAELPVLERLDVTLPDDEFITLGMPANAEEPGKDHKSRIVESYKKVNDNLRYWADKETDEKRKKELNRTITDNQRQIKLYEINAPVLVPLRIGRKAGGALDLAWDGQKGHVRLLSVKDGERTLLKVEHPLPSVADAYNPVFSFWPGTDESFTVRLDITTCLLRRLIRRKGETEKGEEEQRVSFDYCPDPLFDRLLWNVEEGGSTDLITWAPGAVLDAGRDWRLPQVSRVTTLPGAGQSAMFEDWSFSGPVSLKARVGSRRTATHTARDGVLTTRTWHYGDRGPVLEVSGEEQDDAHTITVLDYNDIEKEGARPQVKGMASVPVPKGFRSLESRITGLFRDGLGERLEDNVTRAGVETLRCELGELAQVNAVTGGVQVALDETLIQQLDALLDNAERLLTEAEKERLAADADKEQQPPTKLDTGQLRWFITSFSTSADANARVPGSQSVTLRFSDRIDDYLLNAAFTLRSSQAPLICRLTGGITSHSSHFERFSRTWVIDDITDDLAGLHVIMGHKGSEYHLPIPSPALLAILESIQGLFTDVALTTLKPEIVPEDVRQLSEEVQASSLTSTEKAEMLALLDGAQRMLDARADEMRRRVQALFSGAQSEALSPDATQEEIDALTEELDDLFSDHEMHPALSQRLSDAQVLLLRDTLQGCRVDANNRVIVTFTDAENRRFGDYHYFLLLGEADQSELRAGEAAYPSTLDGAAWTVLLSPSLQDTFRLEVRHAGTRDQTCILHQSGTDVFYASQDARADAERRVNALFTGAGFTALSGGVVLSDIESLRNSLSNNRFDDAFLSQLTARLSQAETLLKKEQADLKKRTDALFTDSTRKALRAGARQEEMDSLSTLLTSKNSTASPYGELSGQLADAQMLLLKETLKDVTVSELNDVTVTFSDKAGRDFREYDYYLMLNGKYRSEIRRGKLAYSTAPAPGTWKTRLEDAGPEDTFHIEVSRKLQGVEKKHIVHTSDSPAFYAPVAKRRVLEQQLGALFSGVGQTVLVEKATQSGIDALVITLATLRLGPGPAKKLGGLLADAQTLLLKETLKDVTISELNYVTVTFSDKAGRDFREYDYILMLNGKYRSGIRRGKLAYSRAPAPGTWETRLEDAGPKDVFHIEVQRADKTRIIYTSELNAFYTSAAGQKQFEGRVSALYSGKVLAPGVTEPTLQALRAELLNMKLGPQRKAELQKQFDEAQMLMLKEAVSVSVEGNTVTVHFNRADGREFSNYYFAAYGNGKFHDGFRYPASEISTAQPPPRVYTFKSADSFTFRLQVHTHSTAYVLFTHRETPPALIYPI